MEADFRNIVGGVPERHDYRLALNCGTFLRAEWAARVLKAELPRGAKLLEVGCGLGWVSNIFNSLGFDLLAIDASEETVEEARRRYPGVKFQTAGAEEFAPPETFDAVVAFEVIEHLKDWEQAVRNWKSSLRPGGRLFLSTPNRRYGMDNPFKQKNVHHLREFYPRELREIFPGCELRGINLSVFRKLRWQSLPVRALFYLAAAACVPFEKAGSYAIEGRDNFSGREVAYHLLGKHLPSMSEGLWLSWQKPV